MQIEIGGMCAVKECCRVSLPSANAGGIGTATYEELDEDGFRIGVSPAANLVRNDREKATPTANPVRNDRTIGVLPSANLVRNNKSRHKKTPVPFLGRGLLLIVTDPES